MATSSIFTSVKIKTQQEAEAFVAALEAAEKAPQISRETPNMRYVTNPNEMISVTPELIQYLFDTYESIEIDMNSISSWLTFPDGTHNVKSLSVTNSNIILKDSKFLCEGDINLNNCTIKSIYDDKQSVADFVSNKQVYVSSIYISNVISVGFGISANLPVPVWTGEVDLCGFGLLGP